MTLSDTYYIGLVNGTPAVVQDEYAKTYVSLDVIKGAHERIQKYEATFDALVNTLAKMDIFLNLQGKDMQHQIAAISNIRELCYALIAGNAEFLYPQQSMVEVK
jgi:hypothetical protein